MLRGLGKFAYEERLMRCGLTNLDKRRTRGDLVENHTRLLPKEGVWAHKFFEISMKSRTIHIEDTDRSCIKGKLGPGGIVRGW